MPPTKRDRLESAYYKKENVVYNQYNHAYAHNKKRDKRRETNIEKYGVEREPLSKEELEALIRKQEQEALKLQRQQEEVKEFNEKEWLGDDASDSDDDLEEVSDSDDEVDNDAPKKTKKVRFMEDKLEFEEEDDGKGSSFIVVSNMHKEVDEEKFRNTFEEVGRIKSMCFPKSPANKSLGWSVIEYYSSDAANRAVEEYHKAQNRGKTLNVMKFNMINDFFVIQNEEEDLELEDADSLKNSINMKQWEAASSLLKEKMLLFLTWRKTESEKENEAAQPLTEREQILLSLLEEEHKAREEAIEQKKQRRESNKRKRPADAVRGFTGGLWEVQKKKRRKK